MPRRAAAGVVLAAVLSICAATAMAQPQQPGQARQQEQPQPEPSQQPQQQQPEQAQQPEQPERPQQAQQPEQPERPQQAQQPQQQPQQAEPEEQVAVLEAQPAREGCAALPDHRTLTEQLRNIVTAGDSTANGGLGNHVWAVLVDRRGAICAITRSGESIDDQWLGSRSIAASKAFTANAFSLPSFALSTANLYWPSQPENSLYGLELGNPINPLASYGGETTAWGTEEDPLIGRTVGGTTVFGGGLALYTAEGDLAGALGVSGDESCTDHVIAWKLRHALNLDNVPDGPAADGNDNIIHDLTVHPANGQRSSTSGYGHPTCSPEARSAAERFADTAPTGPEA